MSTRLLILCTANRCRSPMAEAIARDIAARRGIDLDIASAGFLDPGITATPEANRALAERGLDLDQHVSRRCDTEDLRVADLILTMERAHLYEVAAVDATAVARSFPLVEFARLATEHPRTEPFDDWVATLHATRNATLVLRLDTADDVADPTGRSLRVHRRTARQLTDLLTAVLDAVFPPTDP